MNPTKHIATLAVLVVVACSKPATVKAPVDAARGETCDGVSLTCETGLACAPIVGEVGSCRTSCDLATKVGCATGEACVAALGGGGVCAVTVEKTPPGDGSGTKKTPGGTTGSGSGSGGTGGTAQPVTVAEGVECNGTTKRCRDGLACSGLAGQKTVCRRTCDPKSSSSCAGGEKCTTTKPGVSVCIATTTTPGTGGTGGKSGGSKPPGGTVPSKPPTGGGGTGGGGTGGGGTGGGGTGGGGTGGGTQTAGPDEYCDDLVYICRSGLVCTGAGDDYTCHVVCTPGEGGCPSGQICFELNDGTGACWPGQSVEAGGRCDDETLFCADGLSCGWEDEAYDYVCRQGCDAYSDFPGCPDGQECIDQGEGDGICLAVDSRVTVFEGDACDGETYVCGAGLLCAGEFCYRRCAPEGDDCYEGEACWDYGDGTGVCYLPDGTGAQEAGEGEPCDGVSYVCVSGLTCAGDTCLRSCDPDGFDCLEYEECWDYGDGTGVCWTPGGAGGDVVTVGEDDTCDGETQVCASGLVCEGGTCYRGCSYDEECYGDEVCAEGLSGGYCSAGGTPPGEPTWVGIGEYCDDASYLCEGMAVCISSLCYEVCDLEDLLSCPSGLICTDDGDEDSIGYCD